MLLNAYVCLAIATVGCVTHGWHANNVLLKETLRMLSRRLLKLTCHADRADAYCADADADYYAPKEALKKALKDHVVIIKVA